MLGATPVFFSPSVTRADIPRLQAQEQNQYEQVASGCGSSLANSYRKTWWMMRDAVGDSVRYSTTKDLTIKGAMVVAVVGALGYYIGKKRG